MCGREKQTFIISKKKRKSNNRTGEHIMARKHDNKMTSRANTTVNKGFMEKVTKSKGYQANEKKLRFFTRLEKFFSRDHSNRKKENE